MLRTGGGQPPLLFISAEGFLTWRPGRAACGKGGCGGQAGHWVTHWQQFPKDEGRCDILGWALCLLCVSAVSVTHGGPTKETVGHLEGGEGGRAIKEWVAPKKAAGCNARVGSKFGLLQSLANSVPGPAANRESQFVFLCRTVAENRRRGKCCLFALKLALGIL